ncbi:hypothetical protein JYU34_022512 [Plutella xylostella]|uniref:Zinc finger DNA binding protein n=1 Tax=Plutella xylostella TaxID=51655 RepID=A0ABQ7PPX5_PLUXY|nr:hypothetical protein JYU34_022512 [Plutella xylostella]
MVIKKCANCKKSITKKATGLECSRCDKIVHADTVCAKLSNKQLNTLRNTPGIEWSCEVCLKNTSHRSSFVIPDDDGDDEESETGPTLAQPIDTRKLVQDISREIKKTFREEIGNLESSLEFLSDQICTIEQSIRNQDKAIKDLEHKNQDLLNKNKNLELRVSVLEQGMKNFEQKALASTLEIAGLPDFPIKDVSKIVETTASKLNLETSGIQSSQRMPGSKDKAGTILVEMKTKAHQKQWIDASKEKCLTVGLLFPDAPQEKAENRVYIREALTKNLKTLLYNAKTQLNKSFQFIWCKDGKVCVRRTTNSKIYYINSLQDITEIVKQCKQSTPLTN